MSDIIYILSKVDVSDRTTELNEVSFEKVTKEKYDKFCKLKDPTLHFSPGKHHYVDVELNDEWNIEVIKDKNMIKAINTLWEYLPKNCHISQALENNE